MTRPKAKKAANGGRPRRAVDTLNVTTDPGGKDAVGNSHTEEPNAAPVPLALYDSAFLGALKAWMLNEVDDDPEVVAEVKAAFAQLETEDATLRSHGESVSDETTTRTSGSSNARERGGQE